jgi:predicted nucleic acid-binding protein
MGKRYLMDTNVIIDFSSHKLTGKVRDVVKNCIDDYLQISIVTKIELLVFSGISNKVVQWINSATIIGLTDDVVEKTIQIRKAYRLQLPDAIIAATSIATKSTIITRNISDFKKVTELDILDFYSE